MAASTQRGALTRESVLAAALRVADREGLGAVSMRRVGEELGVEAMSLYHHVASKAAMLDGIFEIVLAELPPVRPGGPWTEVLRARARALRDVLRAHPNTLPLFATRPAATPGSLAHVEVALEELRTAGFAPREALSALHVLVAFVVGHTVSAHAPATLEGEAPAYAQLRADAFPRVREIVQLLPDHDTDAEFELGLDAMLVGLAARLAAPPAPTARRGRSAAPRAKPGTARRRRPGAAR